MKNEYQCVVLHSRAESPNLKSYRDIGKINTYGPFGLRGKERK